MTYWSQPQIKGTKKIIMQSRWVVILTIVTNSALLLKNSWEKRRVVTNIQEMKAWAEKINE